MDTLTSSVSTLKIPSLPPTTNREFHHFTTTTRPPHVSSSTSIPNLVPPKTKTFSHKNCFPSPPFSSPKTSPFFKFSPSSSPTFHHKPATGYAAAIIDVAQNSNSLHSVQRDVHRLLKFLQHVKFHSDGVDVEEVKGEAVRKVVLVAVEQGNFHGHVTALVKMLMKKKTVGILEQVLEEFERIYDELCGTQVVLVSSANNRMGKDELLAIAKSVHQLSGAARVKVRNLVQQRHTFPSFAVSN